MADVLIPSLTTHLTNETLAAATSLHNAYLTDVSFPQVDVSSDGFKELCSIIAKYNLQSKLRLRLLHRHLTLPDGQILLGMSTTGLSRQICIKPTIISNIAAKEIHGHIFSAKPIVNTSNDEDILGQRQLLMPSEFRHGPSPLSRLDANFVIEFVDCLYKTGFENVLGLEAKKGPIEEMVEYSGPSCSILIPKDEHEGSVQTDTQKLALKTTGWVVVIEDRGISARSETYCVFDANTQGHVEKRAPPIR